MRYRRQCRRLCGPRPVPPGQGLSSSQLAYINGELGSYLTGSPANGPYPEVMPRVTAMTVRDGRVSELPARRGEPLPDEVDPR